MLALLAAFALAVPPAQGVDAIRPPIVQHPIPFGTERKRETAAYARRLLPGTRSGAQEYRPRVPRK